MAGVKYMGKIKITFFDIDGTLIDSKKKKITQNAKNTLLRLQENGIKICIATGRSPVEVPDFESEGVKFDAFLTFNGSYCFNDKEEIFHNPLDKDDVKQILQNAKELGHYVQVATKDRLGANGREEKLVEYFSIVDQEVHVVPDFEKMIEEDVYQIMMAGTKKEYKDMVKNTKRAAVTAWWPEAVDIIPLDGGKGNSVKKILEYYQIEKEEAMAFGDGNNDLDMLREVGHAVAMGNASKELKEIADVVCGDVSEDGIYTYCKEHDYFKN